MSSMLIVIGTLFCITFGVSAASFAKEKTGMALTQLVGASFLLVVIFAHFCEAFGLIPSLGWGQPNSIGHYIDLFSSIAGVILLFAGYVGRRVSPN